jgi:2',3'-cyclic-nucleotide 2'-phosphodiesterase (5'-nucleotidase family)
MNKTFILLLLCSLLAGCGQSKMAVTRSSSVVIPVNNAAEINADKEYTAYLQPIKDEIDKEMNVVIGYAPEAMTAGKSTLENTISNYCTEVYRKTASEFLKQPVDIAIANYGGFRSSIPAGNVTVGTVFKLLPFENELVILWLRGDKLEELLQFFASIGGESELGVTFTIQDKKAVDIKVNGEDIDKNRVYTIATNDYCAGGNDKMFALAKYEKRINTSIKLRNMLIDYIKKETKKGNAVKAALDGRIKFANQE